METKTDIRNELTLLSPLIAGINKVNVFTVPQGYFDTIPNTVLACLKEELFIAPATVNAQSQQVPEGYFDQLAGSVLNKINAAESAPDEIRALSPLLYIIQNKNIFEIPEGYFENAARIIIDTIKTPGAKEELIVISPLLYNLQKHHLFTVPVGYFTSLSDDILKKVVPQKAKVVSMRNRSLFVKYAVAAMLTGAMALGIYKYVDKAGKAVIDNNLALDAAVEKGKNMNDQQFNEALASLTEADIAKYLDKNGDIMDVAVLRNNLEESNLPSQEDYLLDEKTLEDYLKEIEKTTINN